MQRLRVVTRDTQLNILVLLTNSVCLLGNVLVKSRGFAHLAALGLVLMVLHYVIVKTVVLVGLTGMHKTGCFGETRLVLHAPSSS